MKSVSELLSSGFCWLSRHDGSDAFFEDALTFYRKKIAVCEFALGRQFVCEVWRVFIVVGESRRSRGKVGGVHLFVCCWSFFVTCKKEGVYSVVVCLCV